MSTEDQQPDSAVPSGAETPAAKRSLLGHISRGFAWLITGVLVLIVVLVGGFWWYSTTDDFQGRVGKEVVSVLENGTGGRVELGGIKFSLWHLAIEADGLVIHGLEGPDQAPYLSADRIFIRVKITSFFAHTAGTGLASHVGLNLLRVEHPQMHLIVDKDGKTNQPVPKHPATSTEPLQDTLLDLRAGEVELVNGVALLNDKAIPFEMAARDLNTEVSYQLLTDRYKIKLDLNDLRTKMAKQPEAQSRLHMEAEMGRDVAQVTQLDFDSGKSSVLRATAKFSHFAKPEWQGTANGSLELKQISVLGNVDGLTGGTIDLDLKGHSCAVSPTEAQKHPHFWQRKVPAKPSKPGVLPLPPDPECKAGYLLVGSAKLHGAGYENEDVRLHDVDGGAQIHITPAELLLTAVTGYLPGGGYAARRVAHRELAGRSLRSRCDVRYHGGCGGHGE